MAVVATLDIALRALTKKFDKGLSRTQKGLKTFASGFSRLLPSSLSIGIASLSSATGAIVGLGAVTKKAIDDISRLADVGQKLGIDPTQLKALEVAADRTGVAATQLETGLQRMTRRIAEAAKGSGEAKKAIAELGLSATELARLPIREQFLRVGDALNKIQNPTERIRLAFKLFDSEGVNLIRTLGLGRSAINDISNELERAGLVIDDDTIAATKQLEVQWSSLQVQAQGLGTTIASEVVPALADFAKQANPTIKAADGFKNIGLLALRNLTKPGGFAQGALGAFPDLERQTIEAEKAIEAQGRLIERSQEAQGIIDRAFQQPGEARIDFTGFQETPRDLDKVFGRIQGITDSVQDSMLRTLGGFRETAAGLLADGAQVLRDLETEFKERQLAMKRGAAVAESLATPIERFENRVKDLSTLFKRGGISRETLGRGVRDARERFALAQADPASVARDVRPAAVERGTQEAFALIQRALGRDADEEPPTRKVQEEQRKLLARIERKLIPVRAAMGI